MNQGRLLSVAARSASYSIILQVCMRLVTFLLNAFIVHYVTKDVLGIINVRLMLLYTTTQFLSREAFRRACLSNRDKANWIRVINLLWVTVPVSLLWAVLFRFVWLYLLSQPRSNLVSDYQIGIDSMILSVFIEMLAEPLVVFGQAHHFIKLRVVTEGLSLCAKCSIMATAITFYPYDGILVFSVAQVAASTLFALLYYVYFAIYLHKSDHGLPIRRFRQFFPSRVVDGGTQIDGTAATLTWSFFKQTCVKQVLTEGERYVMTLFNALSFAEQGIYDVVNNLGSLAARFVFQPIEENGYLFFVQSLKRGESNDIKRDDLFFVALVLQSLLKVMLLLGLTGLTFGYSYSNVLLYLYGGESLSEGVGSVLLRCHCIYIVFLAVNGPTECFVMATMNPQEIEKYNRKMVLLSVLFLAASYYLTTWLGSVGFIVANCLNMGARIIHSMWYISVYFGETTFRPLRGLILHPLLLIVLLTCSFFTSFMGTIFHYSEGLRLAFCHIFIGTCCLVIFFLFVLSAEKQLIVFLQSCFLKKNV